MTNKPFISILIPIFNVESYLEECLNSIINQSLVNIEIICINDGSTDNSLEIIKKYMQNDQRIKLINKSNSGYGDSMNQGLDIAIGEYIGIIESDDIAKKSMYKTLFKLAIKNDFPDIVKSNYNEYWGKTKEVRYKNNIPKKLRNHIFKPKNKHRILESAPSIWSAIYKNDFIKKYKIKFLPTKGASYQDTSFNFKALYFASSMYCSKKALLKYRQDNINSSVNNKEKVFCINDEYEEIEKTIYNDEKIKSTILPIKFNTYLWNYHRLDTQYKDVFLTRTREEFLDAIKYIQPKNFKKNTYSLLIKLLNSVEEFKEELNKRNINHLDTSTKKLLSIIKNYRKYNFIIYGFNNIAKNILKQKSLKISFILDRNSENQLFNNIPIYNIRNIHKSFNDEIFIITAINPIFIYEIKKTILLKFPKAKIISL